MFDDKFIDISEKKWLIRIHSIFCSYLYILVNYQKKRLSIVITKNEFL